MWVKPGGAASVGFHLRHVAGSIDRLLTYGRGEQLDEAQRSAVEEERAVGAYAWTAGAPPADAATLMGGINRAVEDALGAFRRADPKTIHEPRLVGRAGLPSTALGLYFHVAEHAQRHAGQIITTAKIVRGLGLGAERSARPAVG
jgi:hypothetical protein